MFDIYSCEFDGEASTYYLERIETSDEVRICCETGIAIPAGMPYAHCRLLRTEESFDEGNYYEDLSEERQREIFDSLAESFYQCIEIWRWLRNGNLNWNACTAFGYAAEGYADAYSNSGDQTDRLRYLAMLGVKQRAQKRYEAGKGPRLHLPERESLESGAWVDAIPFTVKCALKEAA